MNLLRKMHRLSHLAERTNGLRGLSPGKGLLLSLSFFLLLLCSQSGKAQDVTWTKIDAKDNVVAYYRIEACDGQDLMLLKLENISGEMLSLNWELQIETTQGPGPVQPGGLTYLPPNSVQAADCLQGLPILRMPLMVALADGEQPKVTINMQVGR